MRSRLLLSAGFAAALAVPQGVHAQTPSNPDYRRVPSFPSVRALVDSLGSLARVADPAARTTALDRLWAALRADGQVPFAVGDSVVWMARVPGATAVAWAGDMTGWSPNATGQRVGATDLWTRRDRLPADARVDYKVVVGGSDWRLDAVNPLQQWSGFGPNSELRMPAYRYPTETVRTPATPAGTLGPNERIASTRLGYAVQYRVYTPPGYAGTGERLPVVYVTDGHEYAPDALGALVTVLDNGIANRTVRPVIAVFIDPRNPDNLGQNRRENELVPPGGRVGTGRAPQFLAFVADELVPALDARLRTLATPEGRGIVGTSLGAIFAAYAGTERPDVFGAVAMMSPAFWAWDTVYGRVQNAGTFGPRLFLSQGTLQDGDGGTRMSAVLAARGASFTYVTRAEGHSWGQWRALEGPMLRTLFPGAAVTSTTGRAVPAPGRGLHLDAFPTPARRAATFRYVLDAPAASVRLALFDARGREVRRLFDARPHASGTFRMALDASGLAAGRYTARLSTPTETASAAVVLL